MPKETLALLAETKKQLEHLRALGVESIRVDPPNPSNLRSKPNVAREPGRDVRRPQVRRTGRQAVTGGADDDLVPCLLQGAGDRDQRPAQGGPVR